MSNPDLAKEVLSIRVKYPFRPEVEIVKIFGIRNNKEEGLGTLYDHFSKPVYRLNNKTQTSELEGLDGNWAGGLASCFAQMGIIIINVQPTQPPTPD